MNELLQAFGAGLRPDLPLTVSEWSDAYRHLSSRSAEPGPWRTHRTPYLREPMDALGPWHPCERVVLMFGAQLGKTESILCALGHSIHLSPGPTMLVQPTVEMVEAFSKERVMDMVRASKELSSLVAETRGKGAQSTITLKSFPGGFLRLSGANSAASLRSTPIRRLFLDEVDAYPLDVEGEGDPVALAIQRTATFGNRKILLTSTPTTKGSSRIEQAWELSDQRRYFVACPHCNHRQHLRWPQLRWPDGDPRGAFYVCEQNGCIIQEHHKGAMLSGGEWRATAKGDGRTQGYHLSALASPPGWLSWGDLAQEFAQCASDPVKLKVFVNTKLGETWEERGAIDVSPDGLLGRREQWWPLGVEPPWAHPQVQVVTAGVDVQADRLELELVGWGPGEESWSLAYLRLDGDPQGPLVWRELDKILGSPIPSGRPGALPLIVTAACVDSGYLPDEVYRYTHARRSRRIYATKGVYGSRPIWPRRPSKPGKGKWLMYPVGIDQAKASIMRRLGMAPSLPGHPNPGFLHFPLSDSHDEQYFDGLTGEILTVRQAHGRTVRRWEKRTDRLRNEPLDCRVYAYAALQALYSQGFRLDGSTAEKPSTDAAQPVTTAPSTPRPTPPPPHPAPRIQPRRTSGWFQR